MTDYCSVDGCVKPARARGMCAMHYERTRRFGTPGKAAAYSCTICDSRTAAAIDRLLLVGMSCEKVAARFDLVSETVRRHASRHLSLVLGHKGQCTVCVRPDLDDIERAMQGDPSIVWLASLTGLSRDALRAHKAKHVGSVDQAAFIAARQVSLLMAARRAYDDTPQG